MKIIWVSPAGAGLGLAGSIVSQGHNLVVYGEHGDLPGIEKQALWPFCKGADLVVVDGPFPLVKTRRSWAPSKDSLFIDEMRRFHGVKAVGPTPTVDLLVGDARYFRKWCARLGLSSGVSEGEVWTTGGWYRGRDVVPPGPLLDSWKNLFKSVGFRGWFELRGVMTGDGPILSNCNASWPVSDLPDGREVEFLEQLSA